MTATNYFKDLNLNIDATATDVRDAYKRLAKQWHPDKNKDEGAEEKFKQILAAYTHLQSDDRRETHAREINRQRETPSVPKPSPPPAQTKPKPEQTKTTERPTSEHQQTPNPSNTHPKSAKSKNAAPKGEKNWWESFKAKNPSQNRGTPTNKPKQSRKQRTYFFMDSFMGFDDPLDDLVFNIFMIPPERPAPKPKQKADRFGNKLPNNVGNDIYDWKSATKNPGQMPDYQEYLDGETEFCCNWCGKMMDMEMLRKHEPRCQRLGGKRVNSGYRFNDEDVNEAYAETPLSSKSSRPKSSVRKIKCRWCGEAFSKNTIAQHLTECEHKISSETPHRRQPRPEWNNNFTETDNDDPSESLFGPRPRSAKIDINNFNPFTGATRSTCLQCKVKYGLAAPNYCIH